MSYEAKILMMVIEFLTEETTGSGLKEVEKEMHETISGYYEDNTLNEEEYESLIEKLELAVTKQENLSSQCSPKCIC